jgi:hypothetical protein
MPNLVSLTAHGAAICAALAGFVMLGATERSLAQDPGRPSTPVTVVNPATSPVPTSVVNPATMPALTSSVDDPGRIAYQVTGSHNSFHAPGGGSCEINFSNVCVFDPAAIPVGKRLVLQHVSFSAGTFGGTFVQVTILTSSANSSNFFVPVTQAFGLATGADDKAVQLYIDGGRSLSATLASDADFKGGTITLTLTGYLLDCAVSHCEAIAP